MNTMDLEDSTPILIKNAKAGDRSSFDALAEL